MFRSFWCADVKNNFKKIKKHHLNVFRHEKHFEKLQQPHSQTDPYNLWKVCLSRIKKETDNLRWTYSNNQKTWLLTAIKNKLRFPLSFTERKKRERSTSIWEGCMYICIKKKNIKLFFLMMGHLYLYFRKDCVVLFFFSFFFLR